MVGSRGMHAYGRAEQRRQLRERAAEQHAGRVAVAEHLEPGRCQRAHRHRLGHRGQQRRAVVAGGAERQAALGHRPMERHRAVRELPGEQRRQVAVADEDLGIVGDPARIEQRQQLLRTVAAPHGDHAADRRVLPGLGQRRHPRLRQAGDVAVPGEDTPIVHRLEAEGAQLVGTAVEVVGPHRAGRRDQRDPIADPQPARPAPAGPCPRALGDHWNPAISAATSWCSSQPTTARQAAPAPRRRPRRRRGSVSWRAPCGPAHRRGGPAAASPFSTAFTSASSVAAMVAASPLHTSTPSQPAAIARTADSAGSQRARSACISRSSLRITPGEAELVAQPAQRRRRQRRRPGLRRATGPARARSS